MTIHGKITVKLRILRFKKLPEGSPHSDESRKEMPLYPVIRVNGSILIDRLVSVLCGDKPIGRNSKELALDLGICIDGRDKYCMWIELSVKRLHLSLILHDCVGNIRPLDSSLAREVGWVHDIHDLYRRSSCEVCDDIFGVCLCLWGTGLSCEEDRNTCHIRVVVCNDRFDILSDYIVGLSVDRHHYEMLEEWSVSSDDLIIVKSTIVIGEELKIGLEYIKIGLKHLDRPIRYIESDKKESDLIVDLYKEYWESKHTEKQENWEL